MPAAGRSRAEINRQFAAVDAAYKAGDMDALRAALANPPDFPNCHQPHDLGLDVPLEYAIYHSPLAFIRALIDLGADPNYEDAGGFPSLIAALSTQRPDKFAILRLLLDAGARTDQRGVNDWTPLHWAAGARDLGSICLLLKFGADPSIPTRIDDCKSAIEEAEANGFTEVVALFRASRAHGDGRVS